ncbi:MAG: hypothetical protein KatS3mg031_0389 [Chitinophagales bacterium]|nr:MAG: hypothetical protein KatS3mg031_0389 [Chitinophagales bacterium]
MKNTFTHYLLIKKIYGEISKWEEERLQEALAKDWALKEELEDLEETARLLNSASYSPGNNTIKAILQYSRNAQAVVI